MKNNTLVQLIVIYFGISAMYTGIGFILPDISSALTHAFGSAGEAEAANYYELTWLVSFVLFFITGFIIVAKSGAISSWVCERASIDDSLKVYTKAPKLLSMFILILALGRLLDYVPKAIEDLLRNITGSESLIYFSAGRANTTHSLFDDALNILFPCLIIIYCKPLTAYFSKNILMAKVDMEDDEVLLEHETITLETTSDPEPVE